MWILIYTRIFKNLVTNIIYKNASIPEKHDGTSCTMYYVLYYITMINFVKYLIIFYVLTF